MNIQTPLQGPRSITGAVSALCTALCTALLAACAAPFSDYQGAHTLAPGEVELTPSYSSVHFTSNGESEKVQDEFGLQLGVGAGERVEIRTKFFALRVADEGDSETYGALGAGPKISLVEDRLALYAPLGIGFGSGIEVSETLQFQPTVLVTLPLSDQVELNPSAKALFWLNNDADNLVAVNLGMGIGPDLRRWAIRPEVGLLFNPGEDGAFFHFGVGFSAAVGKSR